MRSGVPPDRYACRELYDTLKNNPQAKAEFERFRRLLLDAPRLTQLEKAIQISSFCRWWNKLFSGANARGGSRGNQYTGGKRKSIPSFQRFYAAWTQCSVRSVEKYLAIARMHPSVIREIRGTGIENRVTELVRLVTPERIFQRLALASLAAKHSVVDQQLGILNELKSFHYDRKRRPRAVMWGARDYLRTLWLDQEKRKHSVTTSRAGVLHGAFQQQLPLIRRKLEETDRTLDVVISDIPYEQVRAPGFLDQLGFTLQQNLPDHGTAILMISEDTHDAVKKVLGNYLTYHKEVVVVFIRVVGGRALPRFNGYIGKLPNERVTWADTSLRLLVFSKGGQLPFREGRPDTFICADRDKTLHEYQHPVSLFRDVLQWFLPVEGREHCTVVDIFAGSAAALIAALELGTHAYGIEVVKRDAELADANVQKWFRKREAAVPDKMAA